MPARTNLSLRLLAVLATFGLLAAGCGDDDDSGSGSDTTSTTTEDASGGDAPDIELLDDSLDVELLADGFDQPTSMAFAGDDLLVTEKGTGRVLRVGADGATDEVLDLAVNSFDERGLLGIAVHPELPDQPYVYLHWTASAEGDDPAELLGEDTDEATEVSALGNRIDRFLWEDGELTFDRNLVRFPSNTLDSDTSGNVRGNHDAGPLAFGPDGKLYTMMGDQNLRGQMQNIPSGPAPDDLHLAGVILRLNDDGTVPSDNPFVDAGAAAGGEVGENLSMVWAYGVRNSFGLAFEPTSGALWQTENGDDSYDEVNVFEAGANSGWVHVQGPPERFDSYRQLELDSEDGIDTPSFGPEDFAADETAALASLYELPGSRYTAPVLSWLYPPAVTAIGFVADDRLGPDSERTAWMGTVLTDSLLRYPVAEDGRSLDLDGPLADLVDDNTEKGDIGESEPYVVGTGFGVIADLDQGPDGAMYVLSLGSGTVYRLTAAE